ncbi:hypothetical protein [Methylobacterium sp. CCH5-D2]|nr:hypothetical protein [Methylobacterium sp. CCH5-D2]
MSPLPSAFPLTIGLVAFGTLLILALADRFAADEVEYPTHNSARDLC